MLTECVRDSLLRGITVMKHRSISLSMLLL